MADNDEIVVIGNPTQLVSGVFVMGGTQTGGPAGGMNVAPLIAQNQAAAAASVEVDSDASDEEILVIARNIRGTILNALNQLNARMGYQIVIPCLSEAQAGNKIRAMLGSLKFKVTSKEYGTGRAGANNAGTGTTSIPVEINKEALRVYGKLDGGVLYLIFHEIAHTFEEMRQFTKSQFETWLAREGAGLSGQALKDAYAKSPEFAANEARTNSIARGLVGLLNNMGKINFNPTFGYANC